MFSVRVEERSTVGEHFLTKSLHHKLVGFDRGGHYTIEVHNGKCMFLKLYSC